MVDDGQKCEHNQFETKVDVNRLSEKEGGAVTGYSADIQIRCAECKTPFAFKGLSAGSMIDVPTVSAVYAEELRAPIEPAPGAPSWEANADFARKFTNKWHGTAGTS